MDLKQKIIDKELVNEIRIILSNKYGKDILKKRRVLCIGWFTEGREIDQMKFCISFIRDFLNWEIDFISAFNPLPALFRKYDLVIISGIVGAVRGINYSNIIFRDSSIPLFTSYTEGIFRESEIEEFTWGHLKKNKTNNWTSVSLWSRKYLKLVKKYYPKFSNTFYVSGSLGIDNYIIGNSKINKYDFGIILNDDLNSYKVLAKKKGTKYANKWLKEYHLNANQKIVKFVKTFSNLGFRICIKPHPGLRDKKHQVLKKISNIKNVEITNLNYPIKDFLNNCNILLTQNSTTSIQALCLNKPVYRIGEYPPCFDEYTNFPELEFLKNELNQNKFSIDKVIEEYDFLGLNKKIITNTVGYFDGFNHVRFLDSIFKFNKIFKKRRIKFNTTFINYSVKFYILKLAYKFKVPFAQCFKDRYMRFSIEKLNILLDQSSEDLISFYTKKKKRFFNIIK